MSFISSSFPSCFRPSKTTENDHLPPSQPPPLSASRNLTTYIYHTDAGTVSLSWSRSILGRSLHVHLHHHHPFHSSSFHLHMKPFILWKKHGTKKLSHNTRIFWNLSKARFGSGPEPQSGFYVSLVVDNALTLLVGDVSRKDAQAKCKARNPNNHEVLLLKREHVDVVSQHTVYNTRAKFGGKVREIEIDFGYGDKDNDNNSRLLFIVDGERVLEVERLKWKFRGNERVEVDGVPVLISWDVHDWVFKKDNNSNKNNNSDGHAVFMFKFEEDEEERSLVNLWTQQNWNLGSCEWGKTGKSWSSSSLSVSSNTGSCGGSSSVMEWSSVEENELVVPVGFSLLVYAWKR